MAVVVYTPAGEPAHYKDYRIGPNGVLTGFAANGKKTVYGPAGWWRVEEIPDAPAEPVDILAPSYVGDKAERMK